MKKILIVLFSFLGILSCSLVNETQGLSFHSDCLNAFIKYLKENPEGLMDEAYQEALSKEGESVYVFSFSEGTLSGYKTSYQGKITLTYSKNKKSKLQFRYLAQVQTSVSSNVSFIAETEQLVSDCVVSAGGMILDGYAQVRRSTTTVTIGYTEISNLEGFYIILPVPKEYAFIK